MIVQLILPTLAKQVISESRDPNKLPS